MKLTVKPGQKINCVIWGEDRLQCKVMENREWISDEAILVNKLTIGKNRFFTVVDMGGEDGAYYKDSDSDSDIELFNKNEKRNVVCTLSGELPNEFKYKVFEKLTC